MPSSVSPSAQNVSIGDYVACRLGSSFKHGLYFSSSAYISIINVKVMSPSGMAFVFGGGKGAPYFNNLTITRDTDLPTNATVPIILSTYADGLHFTGLQIGPTMVNSVIAFTNDDAVNLQGCYGGITQYINATAITVSFPAGSQVPTAGLSIYAVL